MALRLAWQLGEADVDGMLGRLTPGQFREWCAYFELEPWGPVQEDYRAGVLAARVHNAWFSQRLGPDDFFPSLREQAAPARRKTPQELILTMQGIVAAHGGEFQ